MHAQLEPAKAYCILLHTNTTTTTLNSRSSIFPAAQADKGSYCGSEIVLSPESGYAQKASGDWYRVSIPLADFGCDKGSAGSLAAIDRVDLQNLSIRDADVCLDNIALK